jgi:SAM-dependent methyltransferase
MGRKSEKLDEIQSITIGYYNQHAEAYWRGTSDHDVAQNYAAFLAPFPKKKMLDILDLGCGPGRDVKYFKSLGHRPVGLDGSEVFCSMAREFTGCEILNQKFLNLEIPAGTFDGIFANASLFHVPSQALPRVLYDLYTTLRPGGILFSSNPRGHDEGWSGQRFGHYMQLDTSKQYLEDAGFEIIDYYYRPLGKPKDEQPWLAMVANKPLL